jgi:hypothetical protein
MRFSGKLLENFIFICRTLGEGVLLNKGFSGELLEKFYLYVGLR